jgi:hypothetical protein
MTPSEARELVLDEGIGERGIVVRTRMGDDPGQVRMDKLLEAFRVLFDELQGSRAIDRELAYALFGIAHYVEANIDSWARNGKTWRSRLIDRELPAILIAVESVFSGEWAEAFEEPDA